MSTFLFYLASVIHVAGAIIGIGPAFSFAILGSMAGRFRGGEGSIALIEAVSAVRRKLLVPVAAFTQPVSGVYLIFATGRDARFFENEWLWIGILLFAVVLFIGFIANRGLEEGMIAAMREGRAATPEFQGLVRKSKRNGMAMMTLILIIIILMVVKPGA